MLSIKKIVSLTTLTFLLLPGVLSVSAEVVSKNYDYNTDASQDIIDNKTSESSKNQETPNLSDESKTKEAQSQETDNVSKLENTASSDSTINQKPNQVEEQENIQDNNTNSEGQKVKPSPRLGVSSGFNTNFVDLSTPDTSRLHIQTASDTIVQVGIGIQYETRISIDPEIAVLFDAVQNSGRDLKQYLSGSLTTVSIVGIGAVSYSIQEAWNRDPSWLQSAKYTAHYDSSTKSIIVRGNKLLFTLSNGWLNTDIRVNLNQMKMDTGVLVERRPVYQFKTVTATTGFNWAVLGDESKLGAIYPDFENSWIENKVEPTTIQTNDQINLFGRTIQDRVNEHPTDYSIELRKSGVVIASNIPIDTSGNWSYKMPSSSPLGTKITARVVGKEKAAHENGWVDTKYSLPTSIFLGEGGEVPFDKWQVKPPTLAQAYSGETAVKGYAPEQNLDDSRTYTLYVRFNNASGGPKMVLQKNYTEGQEYIGNIFGQNLKAGDNFEAWIVGKDGSARTKESKHVFMTVLDTEDTWSVNAPVIDEIYEGDDSYYISTPTQSGYYGRTYDLNIWINGTLSQTVKNISSYGGEGYYPAQLLKAGDKVTAQIVGHQSGKSDQVSAVATQIVKSRNTAPIVKLPKTSDSTTSTSYTLTGGTVIDTTSADMTVSYTLDNGTSISLPKVTNTTKGKDLPFGDIKLTSLSVGTHTIKVSAKDTEGLTSNIATFTLTVDNPVPGQAVTINYVDAADNSPIGPKQKVINGNVGESFSEDAPAIPGYEKPTPSKVTGTYSDKTQSFTIKYSRKQGAPVTLKYQDEQGQAIAGNPDETLTGLWGETKTVTPKSISGYQFVKQSGLTSDFKVTFGDTAQTVLLTYKKGGTLDLVSAPKLDFGNQKISGNKEVYSPSKDQELTVRDSRARGGWSLAVKVTRPLTAVSNTSKRLENNLFYKTSDQKELAITGVSNVIYSTSKHLEGDTILSKNWGATEGFHLDVLPGQVIADAYSGTLEWTLSDVPQ
ncbi:MucBP domain-containing protein [Lactococcus garvieae]|uniref:MucBP domain-containing protein n=1 Tax=Lactococcus garvieae TaxID=1363 RepID=UPI0002D35DAD|nr:MucBP domain-containing protein [Lactococcus garvieae]